MRPPYITDAYLDSVISGALAEDIGSGDVTTVSTVPEDRQATGRFLAKESGVVAGIEVADRVFAMVDPALRVTWAMQDGDRVEKGTRFGAVEGRARSILVAERLTLNLLQRMSGIATLTSQMVKAAEPYRARILDTRKTAPGLRLLDKWAVRLGGGENHRIGLYDMILIKDNHIEAACGIVPALEAADRYRKENDLQIKIEVEASTLEQVDAAVATGIPEYILLDNMVTRLPDGAVDTSRLKEAVGHVGGRILTEASGNVTLASVNALAATGVDFISCGFLTHSVTALDISLKIALQ